MCDNMRWVTLFDYYNTNSKHSRLLTTSRLQFSQPILPFVGKILRRNDLSNFDLLPTSISPTHHSHHPSPPHSFIPGLKPSSSANPSRRSLPFSSSWPTPWIPRTVCRYFCAFRFFKFSVFFFFFPLLVTDDSKTTVCSRWRSESSSLHHNSCCCCRRSMLPHIIIRE